MKESVLQIGALVGIVSEPDEVGEAPAVLLLNAGLIHRIGPNRLYVTLARRLAEMGMVVLRFDLSGVGDSPNSADTRSFDKVMISDTQAAMDALTARYGVQQFLLMGHCSGSILAFRVASRDERVLGAVIINPEGQDQGWVDYDRKRKLARYYQNYYGKEALTDLSRWKKLLTGKASYSSIARNIFQNILWNKISGVFFQAKNRLGVEQPAEAVNPLLNEVLADMRTVGKRGIHVLFVHSEGSTGLERVRLLMNTELPELRESPAVKFEIIPQADHTFTLRSAQEYVTGVIQSWTEEQFGGVFVTGTI